MAYVEQFDALSTFSTAREAIRFSARLRLPEETSEEDVDKWVDNIISMVELQSVQDRLVSNN